MRRENVEDILSLDSAQAAMLVHSLARRQDDPGLIQVLFRIAGALDDAEMEAAWNDALARHDALRLTVQMPKGKQPMFVLGRTAHLRIAEADTAEGETPEERLSRVMAEDRALGLDLSACPAMRVTCLKLGPEDRQYVWTCHHLFLDGWSASIVLRDVLTAYAARRGGKAPDWPTLPRLRDHAAAASAAAGSAAETAWHDLLSGAPRSPASGILRAAEPGAPRRVDLAIPDGLGARLAAAARARRSTPAALIGAAWSVLLAALCGREDVVFCKTTSGRGLALDGIDHMAGSLSRAVPVRARMTADQSLGDAVQALHRQGFARQPHEFLPFDRIVEPVGDAAFDTLLVIQNHPWDDITLDLDGGVRLYECRSEITSAFPLTLVVEPGEALKISAVSDGSLDPELVADWVGQLPDVLARICDHPDGPVDDCIAAIRVPEARDPDESDQRAELLSQMMAGGVRKARTPTELALARIWQEVLGLGQFDIGRDFVSLGGRSFAAMRILSRIETELGRRVPLVDFVKAPTIPDLAALIDGDASEDTRRWRTLVPFQPAGTRPPMVFLHVSGSHVAFLRPLAQRLGPEQPIYAFQPVGLEGEAPPLKSFEELAGLYVEELLQIQPQGPYHIVGHCAGGRLALEVSHLLRETGREVASLTVLDTPEPRPVAPAGRQAVSLLRRGRLDQIAVRAARKFLARPLRRTWQDRTGELETRARSIVDEVERACFAADVRYKGRHHPGTITLVRSQERVWKTFGWDKYADRVDEVVLPMRHLEMFFEPDVGILAEALSAALACEDPSHAQAESSNAR